MGTQKKNSQWDDLFKHSKHILIDWLEMKHNFTLKKFGAMDISTGTFSHLTYIFVDLLFGWKSSHVNFILGGPRG